MFFGTKHLLTLQQIRACEFVAQEKTAMQDHARQQHDARDAALRTLAVKHPKADSLRVYQESKKTRLLVTVDHVCTDCGSPLHINVEFSYSVCPDCGDCRAFYQEHDQNDVTNVPVHSSFNLETRDKK